ncbi:hypothetical protein BCD67_12840 [Oscillatoriales cyanobacterium USR001]|nr:hypothetical protein BCD67_12840 [Oscillatoriales cyanobacterium USR001]
MTVKVTGIVDCKALLHQFTAKVSFFTQKRTSQTALSPQNTEKIIQRIILFCIILLRLPFANSPDLMS